MQTTTLGSEGLEVGVIGLGCMGMTYRYDMGTPREDATSIAVIRQALDLGVTLIDTADVYGPYTNEELVGRALSGGHRDRAVLATKVGLVETGLADGSGNASSEVVNNARPEHVRKSIDDSLRRLGTDRVDLYQLHRVDPQVPLEETWGRWRRPWRRARHDISACPRCRSTRSHGRRRCIRLPRCSRSCRCGRVKRWPKCCRTARSKASPSYRSRRWDGVSSPDDSPRSTTYLKTTPGARCRASSTTRCAPT